MSVKEFGKKKNNWGILKFLQIVISEVIWVMCMQVKSHQTFKSGKDGKNHCRNYGGKLSPVALVIATYTIVDP